VTYLLPYIDPWIGCREVPGRQRTIVLSIERCLLVRQQTDEGKMGGGNDGRLDRRSGRRIHLDAATRFRVSTE